MIRTLKILGVAFAAMLALSAVMASAASAEKSYTCSAYPCTGTGTSALGNDTFTTEAGTVECASHFEGTLAEASAHLTVKPKYSECRLGFIGATVSMGSCDYTFETSKQIATDAYTAPVEVRCTNAAEPIRIIAGGGICEVTVGQQTPGGHVIITNTTTPVFNGDVDVQATVTGIKYTVTKDGFGCPFSGTGAKEGASYIQHSEMTFQSAGRDIHVG